MKKLLFFLLLIPYTAFLQPKYDGNGIIIEYKGADITLLVERFRNDLRSDIHAKRLGPSSDYYLLTGHDDVSMLAYCYIKLINAF